MASAQIRSGTRGRPPPKRWVLPCTGRSGWSTAHNASETRNPVVVRLFGVRVRVRFWCSCLFIPQVTRSGGYSDRLLIPIAGVCVGDAGVAEVAADVHLGGIHAVRRIEHRLVGGMLAQRALIGLQEAAG